MDRRGAPSVRGCALRWEDSVTKCWQNQKVDWVDYFVDKTKRSIGLITLLTKPKGRLGWLLSHQREKVLTKPGQLDWLFTHQGEKTVLQVVTKPGQLGWLLTHQSEKAVLPSVDKTRSVGLVTYPPEWESSITKCWQNQEVSCVDCLPTKDRKQVFQSIDKIRSVVSLLAHRGEKWESKSVRKTKLRDQ